MLEVIYRIYEVVGKDKMLDEPTDMYATIRSSINRELLMDCVVCESREHFKDIIRSNYGDKITFRYSKKLNVGDIYCIIIGEHCYNTERYDEICACFPLGTALENREISYIRHSQL